MLVLRLRSFICELQLGRQYIHPLIFILQFRTTRQDSYILYPIVQMVTRHSPFIIPSCLEAHATPSHEHSDCAPCKPPSTHQHQLTPATAPGLSAVPRSEYTHAHETKEQKRKKNESTKKMEKSKNRWQGPARNRKRRCPYEREARDVPTERNEASPTAEETKSTFSYSDVFPFSPGKKV